MVKKLLFVKYVILSIMLFISCESLKDITASKDSIVNSVQNTKPENSTQYNTKVHPPVLTVINNGEKRSQQESALLYEISKSIHPSFPKYTFKLYGQQDELSSTITKIDIFTNIDDKAVQEILIEDSNAPTSLGTAGVSIEDINFDGYNDIMVQGTGAAGPNIPFYFWLWDSNISKYVPSEELKGLLSPEIDYDHKIIMSVNSSSAGAYYTESYYQFIDGRVTLIKEIDRVVDYELKVFKYTVKELIGNKMKVVKEYSEFYEE